jgi:DHA1 family tetracycline resistance protein-like MFS transporter
VFLKDILAFGPGRIGIAVSVLAIVDIFAQGYLSGRLMTIFGEKRVAELGLIINAAGFFILAALAFAPSIILLFIALVVFNIGDGLYQPSSNGIISNTAPEGLQGQVQGASQGIQSIGRVIGPLVAASVYALGASLPYFIGGSLVVVGFFVLLILLGKSQQAELRKI